VIDEARRLLIRLASAAKAHNLLHNRHGGTV
jgi:hypothetical protein